jgi:hypothetical protein
MCTKEKTIIEMSATSGYGIVVLWCVSHARNKRLSYNSLHLYQSNQFFITQFSTDVRTFKKIIHQISFVFV